MAKEELIQFEGLVTEILPDARYRVKLDAGHEIIAYTAGKMKKKKRYAWNPYEHMDQQFVWTYGLLIRMNHTD